MTKTASKNVEELTAATEKSIEEGVEKMTSNIEGATAFGQENMDAIVASSKITAKAAESLNAEIAAFAKKSYEDSVTAAKQLSTCKTVFEYVQAQTDYTRSAMETFVSEATKLNEMYATAAKEAFEPINDRFSATVEMTKTFRA